MQTNAFDAQYIAANDTPWFPYGQSGCEAQLIQADPTTGQWIAKLRGPAGGNLGVHRHYGSVIGFTLHGAWRYLEHEWVSRTGDIVQETPGSVHTLVLEEESEILFIVQGALEYVDREGHTLAHEDWRSIADKYRDFCTARGLSVVDVTRPRTVSRRVEGFRTMAERRTRAGRMKRVHKPVMIRSAARRLGARLRPRLRTSS